MRGSRPRSAPRPAPRRRRPGCTVNLSEKGKGPILGFRLSGNRFGPSAVANCAVIAPTTSDVTVDGDVWDATGRPVTIRKGA